MGSKEAVLLKCGSHFLDLLRETENNQIEVIVVHLYPKVLKKLYIGELPDIIEKQSNRKQSQVVASSDVIAKFIDSLEFYFQNPSLVNNDLLELKIKELILLLVQSKNVNSILELVADLYSTKTVHLKEVVELHLYSNLNRSQLAKLCNLSLSSFKREFKKEFNDSPNNYITGKRLEKAKELLIITDLPISEIAYEVGFQDPLYFTRLFKKNMDITPSNYRVEHSF
ncbi:MAG: helix-turn-helix domain-containing protein [Chitinophagales bacterium]